MYLAVEWNRDELGNVLDSRINKLIEGRYARVNGKWQDVMKESTNKTRWTMLARTMMRPRDLIQFFNFCISKAVDRPQIAVQMLREGEGSIRVIDFDPSLMSGMRFISIYWNLPNCLKAGRALFDHTTVPSLIAVTLL